MIEKELVNYIKAECAARFPNKDNATIYLLALALNNRWSSIAQIKAFIGMVEPIAAKHIDMAYAIAEAYGYKPEKYQAFKDVQLRPYVDEANDLYTGKYWDGLDMTPEEKKKLFEQLNQIHEQIVKARPYPEWPSLGLNDEGEELTWRDAFGEMKKDIEDLITSQVALMSLLKEKLL